MAARKLTYLGAITSIAIGPARSSSREVARFLATYVTSQHPDGNFANYVTAAGFIARGAILFKICRLLLTARPVVCFHSASTRSRKRIQD